MEKILSLENNNILLLLISIIICLYIFYFKKRLKGNPNPNLKLGKLLDSDNLALETHPWRRIVYKKGHEYMKKNLECRYHYEGVVSDKECDYWINAVNEYNVYDSNFTYDHEEPEFLKKKKRIKNQLEY